MPNTIRQAWSELDKDGRLMIAREYISRIVMALILFLCSGNWNWLNAWLLLLAALLLIMVVHFFVVKDNPDLYNERGKKHIDTKQFDRILLPLYALLGYAVLFTAGFDERFGWSDLPAIFLLIGGLLMLLTGLVTTSAMRANQFFSSTVRIQHERGQHVINKGPYSIVRHPGYLGGSLFYLGTFFMLDSLWVLLPAALTIIVLIIRTKLEDDTLQRELNGYKEYTRKVRYRLIPGIW